jgi:diaminopimelate decarboxylase
MTSNEVEITAPTAHGPWLRARDRHCSEVAVNQWLLEFGSPLLVYSQTILEGLADGFLRFAAATGRRATCAFALKACSSHAVLKVFRDRGFLGEVNSAAEYLMALEAGFAPHQIHVNGVAKCRDLIDLAVHKGCRALHLDSVEEIDLVAARAGAVGKRLPVQARVCPDISSAVVPGLMTGEMDSPFGIAMQDLPATWDALRRQGRTLHLQGVHIHAGSGGDVSAVYPRLIQAMRDVIHSSQAAGIEQPLEVNLGGGFVSDTDDPSRVQGEEKLLTAIAQLPRGTDVMFEPGRFLVEYAASLFCRVATIKQKAGARWVVLDAGYCHLSDRAIVDARFPLRALSVSGPSSVVRVAGPLCDGVDTYRAPSQADGSTGVFRLPDALDCGDSVEIGLTGAYVYSTGNHFAGFGQPAVVLVDCNGSPKLIRRREQYEDLRALEIVS